MAMTITPTMYKVKPIKHNVLGDMMYVLRLACTDDNSGGSITMKSTAASSTNSMDSADTYAYLMDQIAGSWLYMMKVVPGTGEAAPTATFDIDVEDETNAHLLDTDGNSNTATSYTAGSNTLGIFPPILDEITVVVAALGASDTCDIYLYFSK